jgi:hypothetical protein
VAAGVGFKVGLRSGVVSPVIPVTRSRQAHDLPGPDGRHRRPFVADEHQAQADAGSEFASSIETCLGLPERLMVSSPVACRRSMLILNLNL